NAGHHQVATLGAVQQQREVVLLGDLGPGGNHHPVGGVPLDVHAEDLTGTLGGLVGGLGDLHPAGLAAPADLHLGLDHHDAAAVCEQLLGGGAGLLGCGGDDACQHRYLMLLEQISCLVLEQVHLRLALLLTRCPRCLDIETFPRRLPRPRNPAPLSVGEMAHGAFDGGACAASGSSPAAVPNTGGAQGTAPAWSPSAPPSSCSRAS